MVFESYVGGYVFADSSNLQTVSIPVASMKLYDNLFNGCSSLTCIDNSEYHPDFPGGDNGMWSADDFIDLPDNYLVYVPADSISGYGSRNPEISSHFAMKPVTGPRVTFCYLNHQTYEYDYISVSKSEIDSDVLQLTDGN